jgi:hypothetical protein
VSQRGYGPRSINPCPFLVYKCPLIVPAAPSFIVWRCLGLASCPWTQPRFLTTTPMARSQHHHTQHWSLASVQLGKAGTQQAASVQTTSPCKPSMLLRGVHQWIILEADHQAVLSEEPMNYLTTVLASFWPRGAQEGGGSERLRVGGRGLLARPHEELCRERLGR